MTKLSLSDHPEYVIDDWELNREAVSYTWMTLEHLREKSKDKIYFLVSDETAEEFYAWGRPDHIMESATLVFGNRPGTHFDWERLEKRMREINRLAEQHLIKTVKRGEKDVKVISIDGVDLEELTIEGKAVPASKIVKIDERIYNYVRSGYVPFAGKVEISSTEVRRRISEGEPITGLVHKRLEEYLLTNGLFKG